MLNTKIKPYETAVRVLYANALGEDAALDDAAINRDLAIGRLEAIAAGGSIRWLSYVHPGPEFKVTQVNVRTLGAKRIYLPADAAR